MPIIALTAPEELAVLEALGADVRCVMEEVGLRLPLQAVFSHLRFGTTPRFVGIEDTKEGVRRSLAVDFGLSAADGMQQRADVADALSVRELSKIQLEREHTLRAENKVNAITAPATAHEMRSMQKRHKLQHGRLETRFIPGIYFLGVKLEQNSEQRT